MTPPDADLVRRFVDARETEAFAELVRRHVDIVYRAALRKVANPHLAEEITQSVFTTLASKASSLRGHQSIIGWLHTATRFAAQEVLRAERRCRHHENEAAIMNETSGESAEQIPWERQRPVIDDALGDLSAGDREAVLLRYFSELPFGAVGAALQITENGARMRVTRALDKLQVELERRGVTSTQAALAATLAAPAVVAAPSGLAASVTLAALAGHAPAAGTGLAFTIMHFMSTAKFVATTAGVISILAIGTAVYQTSAGREAKIQLASAHEQQAALQARLTAAENRTQALATDLAAAQKRLADVRPSIITGQPNSFGTALPPQFDYALTHPEARAAYLQRAALAIKARYQRFFQITGLTGDEQDRFLRFAMDDAERRLDTLRIKLAAEGLLPDIPAPTASEMQEMIAQDKQRQREIGNGLRQLLGERVALAVQYKDTMAERNVADRLASQLYSTNAPLTAEQGDRLTEILSQSISNKKSESAESNAMDGKPIQADLLRLAMVQPEVQAMPWLREAPITDGTLQRASSILSPTQVAALKLIQAQQIAELQLTPPRPRRNTGPGK